MELPVGQIEEDIRAPPVPHEAAIVAGNQRGYTSTGSTGVQITMQLRLLSCSIFARPVSSQPKHTHLRPVGPLGAPELPHVGRSSRIALSIETLPQAPKATDCVDQRGCAVWTLV